MPRSGPDPEQDVMIINPAMNVKSDEILTVFFISAINKGFVLNTMA